MHDANLIQAISGWMNPRRWFKARKRPEGRRTLRNPGWERSPATPSRGWRPCRTFAADPVPMTRQVRRQNDRRARRGWERPGPTPKKRRVY